MILRSISSSPPPANREIEMVGLGGKLDRTITASAMPSSL